MHSVARLHYESDLSQVAIARKLLVVVWHVLMAKSADRRAEAEQVAFKLMVWAWKLSDEQRALTRTASKRRRRGVAAAASRSSASCRKVAIARSACRRTGAIRRRCPTMSLC